MKKLIEICVEIKKTTQGAVLVDDGDDEKWIPRSLIEHDDALCWTDDAIGEIIEIEIPEWFAEKEGFI